MKKSNWQSWPSSWFFWIPPHHYHQKVLVMLLGSSYIILFLRHQVLFFFKYSSRAVPDMLLLDYFVFLISWIIIQLLYFMVLAFKGKDGIEILKWNIEIYLWTAQINTLHILKYFSSFSSSRFPLSPRPDSVHSTTSSSDSHDSDENYVPMNPNQSTDDPVGGFTS